MTCGAAEVTGPSANADWQEPTVARQQGVVYAAHAFVAMGVSYVFTPDGIDTALFPQPRTCSPVTMALLLPSYLLAVCLSTACFASSLASFCSLSMTAILQLSTAQKFSVVNNLQFHAPDGLWCGALTHLFYFHAKE